MGNFQVRFFHIGIRDPDKVRSISDASAQHLFDLNLSQTVVVIDG